MKLSVHFMIKQAIAGTKTKADEPEEIYPSINRVSFNTLS